MQYYRGVSDKCKRDFMGFPFLVLLGFSYIFPPFTNCENHDLGKPPGGVGGCQC